MLAHQTKPIEEYKVPVSAIILTYNDEKNIRRCLQSIAGWVAEIIVVDSFSTDRTSEICKNYGCRFYQNSFINQAIQFNWALDNINIKYDWILRLDSDELVPEKLKKEIHARLGKEEGINGYYMNRRMYFMNRWLKHGRMYPHYILRLFRQGCGRYEQRTEEHLVVNGEVAYLKNDFLEDNRKNTLDYFTEKHLATARGEVEEILNPSQSNGMHIKPKLSGMKVNRTRWLREKIYIKLPLFLRAFLYFCYRYFICLGFLDGKPGLIFHVLQGFWYRFYIDSKIYETKSGWMNVENDYSDIE